MMRPNIGLPLLLMMAASACSMPQTRWEKADTDEKTMTDDLSACRRAAEQEAFVLYPSAFGPPFLWYHRWAYFNDNRFYAESRLTNFCMRNKGYQLITIPRPQPATTTTNPG